MTFVCKSSCRFVRHQTEHVKMKAMRINQSMKTEILKSTMKYIIQASIKRRQYKQNVVKILEYYSVLKGKERPTHTTTWINLEAIMLSETSQTQRTNTL